MRTISDDLDIKKAKIEIFGSKKRADAYHKDATRGNNSTKLTYLIEKTIVQRYVVGKVLDGGTGSGRFAIPIAEKGKLVTGVDTSKNMINVSQSLSNTENLEYVLADLQFLPFKDCSFDSVVSIWVLVHIPQYEEVLKEYIRVVKKGGMMIFDIRSGDHFNFVNRLRPKFGGKNKRDPNEFGNEVAFKEMDLLMESIGAPIKERYTYGLLNNNHFVKVLNYRFLKVEGAFNIIMNFILSAEITRKAFLFFEMNFIRYLPPVLTYKYMIIAKKV